jgi:hypothetical protein
VDKRRRLTLELQHETQQSGSLEVRRVALVVVHIQGNPVTPHAQWLEHLSKSGRQKLGTYFHQSENFDQYFLHITYHSVLYETGTMTLVERVVKHGVPWADVVRKRCPPK